MPQCPHCKTAYEIGQRYCNVCGSFLLHPEEGDTFCPKCDIRVSPRQEFCHECNTPLKGEAVAAAAPAPEPAPGETPAPGPPPKGMQTWVLGMLIGAVVIILILLILLFTRVTLPPAPKAEAPAPPAVAPTPAPPAAPSAEPAPAPLPALREELLKLLSTLRESHLKKDITLFLSVYSSSFPDLDEKRKKTLNAWENYDYTNLVFTLEEIQPLDSENANARATWYIDTKNRRTQELASTKQTFRIRFAKELGKWRIRSLEEVE